MHPFPFPFRSPLSDTGRTIDTASARIPQRGANVLEPGGTAESSPWTDLEAALAGPASAQALAELMTSLEAERLVLDQKIKSMTLDRPGYATAQAYLDAIEASLGFLATRSKGK